MIIPDYLVQNVAWVVIATGGSSVGIAAGTFFWKWYRGRRWKGPDRRAETSILLEFLHRQEERDIRAETREDKLTDALVETARALTGLRSVVEVQVEQCREDCKEMHRRINDHVLKSNAGA